MGHLTGLTEEKGLVSIIILNYNGKHLLDDCIGSIRLQDYRQIEVIVADNASEDGSVEYLVEHFPEVLVVEHPGNYGYAAGNNIAAKRVRGEFLFFLNNDTRLDPHCISALVSAAKECKADICGCAVTDFEGSKPPLVLGCDFLGFPRSGKFFYVGGCAIFFSRSAFNQLGGFDEDYFMFFEDSDICWRGRLSGKRIIYVEEAVVCHMGGATLFGGSPERPGYTTNYQRRYLGERNNLRTLLKNYRVRTLLFVIPIYIFINILEIIVLLLARNPRAVLCYIRAYWSNLTSLFEIMRDRRRVQASRKVGDLEIMRHMSLVPNKFRMLLKVGVPTIK